MTQRFASLLTCPACYFVLCTVFAIKAAGQSGASSPIVDQEYAGDAPIILERARAPREGLHVNPAALSLEMSASYQNSESRAAGSSYRDQALLFSETMTLATSGYYQHPNIFNYTMTLIGGMTEYFDDSSDSDPSETYGALYAWDFSGTFLQTGEWPLTLYTNRQENWAFVQFGGALRTTTTTAGATVSHHAGDTDTILDASHTDSTTEGGDVYQDTHYTADRFSWRSFTALGPRQTLSWQYDYSNVQESAGDDSNFSYETHDAQLIHEAKLGNNSYDTLVSTLTYNQQNSQYSTQHAHWSERLMLKHTPELRASYLYELDYFDYSTNKRYLHHGEAQFIHTLYKSLTSTGTVGGRYFDGSEGLSTTEYYASLEEQYNKKTWNGLLTLDAFVAWNQTNSEGSSTFQTTGQPQTFNDPLPIILTGTNIDPNSIVVRDTSGLLLIPGADYNITTFPDRVEISRIIGGSIVNGQTVLLDYTSDPLPASNSDSWLYSFGIRYNFQKGPLAGLSLYARYSQLTQNLSSDNPGAFVSSDFHDYLYGANYQIGDLNLGAERQEHYSDVRPFNANRYFANYVKNTQDTTYSANASATNIEYSQDNNTIDLYTVSGTVSRQFSTQLWGEAIFLWRWENDTLYGKTEGFEEQLQLRWKYRQVEAYMRVRASQLDTEDNQTHFEFFQVGFIRQF